MAKGSGGTRGASGGGSGGGLARALSARESGIRDSETEKLSAFDANGKELYHTDAGLDNQVEVPDSVAPRLKNAIVTHNHPNGNSFSGGDIQSAIEMNLSEIRVVTSNYTFSMKRPKGGWGSAEKASQVYKSTFSKVLNSDMKYQSGRGDTGFDRSMKTMQHRIVKEFSKQMGYNYSKKRK